jgi:hypothetical protein
MGVLSYHADYSWALGGFFGRRNILCPFWIPDHLSPIGGVAVNLRGQSQEFLIATGLQITASSLVAVTGFAYPRNFFCARCSATLERGYSSSSILYNELDVHSSRSPLLRSLRTTTPAPATMVFGGRRTILFALASAPALLITFVNEQSLRIGHSHSRDDRTFFGLDCSLWCSSIINLTNFSSFCIAGEFSRRRCDVWAGSAELSVPCECRCHSPGQQSSI